MIKTQRIIKYFAIAFALFLVLNIISTLMYGIISISSIFDNDITDTSTTENLDMLEINNNVKTLKINVKSVNVIVKEGSDFKIETNNKYIDYIEENNKLFITEKNHSWLNKHNTGNLIIYVPVNYIFDEISLENGAGKIEISTINVQKLNLVLGAGNTNIQNITVSKSADIDGGAGEVIIENGSINNLDIDMGVGKLTLHSSLIGTTEISAGIGDMSINLIGSLDDYQINLEKGIGTAVLNGEKMKNDTYYGSGESIIEIDGGVGSIKINFVQN